MSADVGAWLHLVGTFDGTTAYLYKNGALVGTRDTGMGPVTLWTGGGVARIGELGGAGGYPLVGLIDEVAVYPTPLTAAQVSNHYTLRTATSSVSLQVVATDGDGDPLVYTASGLPPGLLINPTTGLITGDPLTAGTYTVTVTATDPVGLAGSQSFDWTIGMVVAPPVAAPAGGTYQAAQQVTLTASEGSTITYTVDASDPTSESPVYTSPVPIGFGTTTLKARAFASDGTPSSVTAETYVVQTDRPAPTMTATVSPAPNAAGWNNSNVTVTFACNGVGTVTCPPAVSLTNDGVQNVTGTVSDDIGQTVTTTVTVRIDRLAPVITIASPRPTAILQAGTVAVLGYAADTLADTSVTCDGVAAVMTDEAFACSATLPEAGATVHIVAIDAAGNARARDLTLVTATSMGTAASSLRLTPQAITMTVGQTRTLSVRDNFGRAPQDATWTVDQPSLANLATSPNIALTALAPGIVVVTATWHGLTTTTDVTILAAGEIPAGTTLWAAPPAGGPVTRVIQGSPGADGQMELYALEGTTLRALTTDGAELWAADAGNVSQLSGDAAGGVVAFVNTGTTESPSYALRRYDADGDLMEIGLPNVVPGWKDTFAVSLDGPVYLVECGSAACQLSGKDIGLGAGLQVPLPTGVETTCTEGTAQNPHGCTDTARAFGFGTPTIMSDGRVVVPVVTGHDQIFIDPSSSAESRVFTPEMSVVSVTPGGEQTIQTIPFEDLSLPNLDRVIPNKAIPNGEGGILVTWTASYSTDSQRWAARIAGVATDGTVTGTDTIGEMWGDIALGENGVALAATYLGAHESMVTPVGSGGYAIGSPGFYPSNIDVTSLLAEAGGGFVTGLSTGELIGSDDGYGMMTLRNALFADPSWVGTSASGEVVGMSGPVPSSAKTDWPTPSSAQAGNAAQNPGAGIFFVGHSFMGSPVRHSLVKIVPRHVDAWREQAGTVFVNRAGIRATHDFYFATIGGDFQLTSTGLVVISGINRDTDVHLPIVDPSIEGPEKLQYRQIDEDKIISRLFQYNSQYKSDAPYWPTPRTMQEYNSNSFLRGLFEVASVPRLPARPSALGGYYPGWSNPIPAEHFR